MTFRTILTSKGTTTIPKEIRDILGVKPGMQVSFTRNEAGEIVLRRTQTIEEIRAMNKAAMQRAGTSHIDTTVTGFEHIPVDANGLR